LRINHQAGEVKAPGKYDSLRERRLSILLMTPTLDAKCTIDYAKSLTQTCLALYAAGVEVTLGKTMNSCFVHHARNLNANTLLNTNHTHLLQIDSDMSWAPSVVLDMLLFKKQFIAAVGRKKSLNPEFAGVNYTDENGVPVGQIGDTKENSLVKMAYIGGAFTLHERSVFEDMREFCDFSRAIGYVFYKDEYSLQDWQTEDYTFSAKCKKAGVDIWCYPNVTLGHLGNYDYEGNFFDHLMKKEEPCLI
jgi:hypothetical protein